MEIKGIEFRSATHFANDSKKSDHSMTPSADCFGSNQKINVARKDIVEIMKSANPASHPSVEGYNPPNVALKSLSTERKFYCNVEDFAEKYQPSETPGLSEEAQFSEYSNNMFSGFAHLVSAYEKVFAICDEDITFCTKLVEENTNADLESTYMQMLNDAKTRRKNIGEQAAEELPGRANGMIAIMTLNAKIAKATGNADQKIEELEKGVWRDIFLKLGKFDFSQLSKGYEDLFLAIEELKNMFSKWS